MIEASKEGERKSAGREKAGGEGAAPEPEAQRVYVLRDLEQARVLADALRIRILEAYGREARTTKQLAEILGEKPSKLYHHVDALERAGLVRLERTRQNRGTIEKYFRPVAELFKADPQLFSSDEADPTDAPVADLVTVTFEGAAEELRNLLRSGEGGRLEKEGILTRMHVRGSARRLATIRSRMESLVESVAEAADEGADGEGDGPAYGCLIAFYPLPEPKKRA